MVLRPRRPLHRRPRGQRSGDEAVRPDRRAVGEAGAVAAAWEEARPWRDVPACYGPWQTVYGLFRRWQRAGVWEQIVTGLQAQADAAGMITWDVSVDSTIARAHQHAAGARRDGDGQVEPPGGDGPDGAQEPADHALGRSRGGLTTKIHLACEQSTVRHSARAHPGAAARWRPGADPPGSGSGR